MTTNEFINKSCQFIKESKSLECIDFIEKNHTHILKKDITKIYQNACSFGNVIVVDFLLNTKLKLNIDFDFPYSESNEFEEAIKNGAIFLAGDDHHTDLLEYFIKNDTYYIDFETRTHLETYMSSVVKLIDQIELKLYLEDKMPPKSTQNLKIKNSHIKI